MTSTIPPFARDFPGSTASPSQTFHWPGVTAESTSTVRKVLEENDRKYDIYEKVRFAHNHFPHSILTRYALGAPPKLLDDTWAHDEPYLAALDPTSGGRKTGDLNQLPEKITRENWDDPLTLGLKDAYSRYIVFFHQEIDRLGPMGAIEEYVFSPQANWETRSGRPAPQMIVRLVAGVLHPIIHLGFGIEFRDRVVVAEGLAEAAVHDNFILSHLFTPDWPNPILLNPSSSTAQSRLPTNVWGDPDLSNHPASGKSLLQIWAECAADTQFVPAKYDKEMLINDRLLAATQDGRGAKLRDLAAGWDLSDEEIGDGPQGYTRKLEEIGVLVTLLACGTGRVGKPPRVDFFLMHTLTSSIFLPAYMAVLSPQDRRVVLQTYLLSILITVMARGKPTIDVEYLMSFNPAPMAPGTRPNKTGKDVIADPNDEATRNPWTSIVESSLYAEDSHVPKSIRPLLHYASLHGNTPPGGFTGVTTSDGKEVFKGSSKLDGSMFVRGAGMIMNVMGWCREGQKAGAWATSPIGYDEVWE